MLPKNRLRDDRMARLKTFEGASHPYKQNLLRMGETRRSKVSVLETPEVKGTLAQSKSAAPTS